MTERTVVVACGGLGTRLGYDGQKCVIPVAGRPFLHWKLDQLAGYGATDIRLLTHYGAGQVQAAAGSWEGSVPVRTHTDLGGGAWAAHRRHVDTWPFVHWFTYGDTLLDVPLIDSKMPYVYVNDTFPDDAGVFFCWGRSKSFIRKHTSAIAHHINTPEDLEETHAYLLGHGEPTGGQGWGARSLD